MHDFNGKHRDALSVVAKISWIIVDITAVVLAILLITSAKNKPEGTGEYIDIYGTASPTQAPVPTQAPQATQPPLDTEAPTQTPQPTATPVPEYTEAPVIDASIFEGSAFVGNSLFEGLYRYGLITNADFMTKVGLNILSVYTDSKTGGSIPVIDELRAGNYKTVVLLFGQNELGWPSLNSFIEHYAKLIEDIKQIHPNAQIFLTGLLPVSEAKSAQGGESGVNNERIQMYNEQIEQLARTSNCNFISVPEELMTSNGALVEGASSDGIHLNMDCSKIWAEHISRAIMAAHNN